MAHPRKRKYKDYLEPNSESGIPRTTKWRQGKDAESEAEPAAEPAPENEGEVDDDPVLVPAVLAAAAVGRRTSTEDEADEKTGTTSSELEFDDDKSSSLITSAVSDTESVHHQSRELRPGPDMPDPESDVDQSSESSESRIEHGKGDALDDSDFAGEDSDTAEGGPGTDITSDDLTNERYNLGEDTVGTDTNLSTSRSDEDVNERDALFEGTLTDIGFTTDEDQDSGEGEEAERVRTGEIGMMMMLSMAQFSMVPTFLKQKQFS
ncbi:uncharacterized protein LOC121422956 isoform X1 [Lytechinus variegatus]|uniref:uncharacterized protein LOC121422956 isoform X1 n=1 Tax=Lytechinus variegatus TaxID=7654 RepID=UPI001BB27A7B|nr:uncharacterized protein LOC121422956 isoform X1 [Lytechinus variegatus]